MDFRSYTSAQLTALYRCAKTRARPFFTDPYAMIELRREMQRRRLAPLEGPKMPSRVARARRASRAATATTAALVLLGGAP